MNPQSKFPKVDIQTCVLPRRTVVRQAEDQTPHVQMGTLVKQSRIDIRNLVITDVSGM
jgi:hypothetical protein